MLFFDNRYEVVDERVHHLADVWEAFAVFRDDELAETLCLDIERDVEFASPRFVSRSRFEQERVEAYAAKTGDEITVHVVHVVFPHPENKRFDEPALCAGTFGFD